MRREFGLDKPLITQLGIYLFKVVQGESGILNPVPSNLSWKLIISRLPATFLLMGHRARAGAFVGVFLGVVYTRRSAFSENAAVLAAIAGHSMPTFWVGQILLIIFSLHLGLFPAQGMFSLRVRETGFGAIWDLFTILSFPH